MTMPNDAQVNAGLYQGDGVRGCSQREIARDLHISRSTVAKYLSEDLSPRPHAVAGRTSPTMAPFAEEVVSWLGADRLAPKKQRRTAKRVYDRLVSGYGFPGSRSIVERFVRNWRDSRPPAPAAGFLELGWPSRAARGDYGNAVTGPGSPVGEEGMAAADADGLLAHLGSRHPPDAGVFALGNVPAGLSEDDADLAPGILARIPEHDDSPGGYAREDAAAAPIGDSGMASEGASSERAEDRTSVLGKPSRIGLGDRTGGSGGRPMVGGLVAAHCECQRKRPLLAAAWNRACS